jgi:(p)ppGpp synthase/HD superfamily hydrolase
MTGTQVDERRPLSARTLEDAIALAVHAHAGQRDKVGAPYILHPLRLPVVTAKEAERLQRYRVAPQGRCAQSPAASGVK